MRCRSSVMGKPKGKTRPRSSRFPKQPAKNARTHQLQVKQRDRATRSTTHSMNPSGSTGPTSHQQVRDRSDRRACRNTTMAEQRAARAGDGNTRQENRANREKNMDTAIEKPLRNAQVAIPATRSWKLPAKGEPTCADMPSRAEARGKSKPITKSRDATRRKNCPK